MKSPTSVVEAALPAALTRSSVTTPASIALLTASRIALPSFSSPTCSSIIAADKIVAIGLAMFLPAACG